MKRVLLISGGIVHNVIVIESIEAAIKLYPGHVCVESIAGGIGWFWDGETLTEPPVDETAIHNEAIKQQITSLESTITDRRYREAILGIDNGWLANVDAQIAALRAQLQ